MPLHLPSPSTHHLQYYPTRLKEENKHMHLPREEAYCLIIQYTVALAFNIQNIVDCIVALQCICQCLWGWKSSIQSLKFFVFTLFDSYVLFLQNIVLGVYVLILKSYFSHS